MKSTYTLFIFYNLGMMTHKDKVEEERVKAKELMDLWKGKGKGGSAVPTSPGVLDAVPFWVPLP